MENTVGQFSIVCNRVEDFISMVRKVDQCTLVRHCVVVYSSTVCQSAAI